MLRDADWAFAQYEHIRGDLPAAVFPERAAPIDGIAEIADQVDAFFLDAFGVLNVGETVIPGAVRVVADLQSAGKQVFVLTNGASLPADVALEKYRSFGFDFAISNVIASRDALSQALMRRLENTWGVMALAESRLEEFPNNCLRLGDDPQVFDRVEGFILLGTGTWSDQQQDLLISSLRKSPRPVLVGNPDIVAPREDGLTLEPGWYAHEIKRATGVSPAYFGKPFGNVFDLALSRLEGDIPRHRIAMVGDTLHTDVLGGAAMGLKTVCVTNHGLFAGRDISRYITTSGIVPDWITGNP